MTDVTCVRFGEHEEVNHDDAELVVFDCAVCNKSFKSESQYHNHEQ